MAEQPSLNAPETEQGKKIKIMLVDDHHSARQAYSAFLNEEGFEVIAEASNGLELIQYLQTDCEMPEIVILDIEMPVMNGMEALPLVKKWHPNIKVIILSMIDEDEYITETLIKGASAYLPKKCEIEALVNTINAVHADGFYFNASVSQSLVSSLLRGKSTEPMFKQLLSEREMEVLKLLCSGKSKKQIADSLNLTTDTIKAHIKSIYRKLNVNSVVPLIKYALKNGLVGWD